MKLLLEDGLAQLGFATSQIERIAPQIETYVKELELFNAAYDLVGADTHDDIIIRHILDSLSAWNEIQRLVDDITAKTKEIFVTIADVGSGGGLPGIPLAIVSDNIFGRSVQFELIERMSKRCAFLENCIAMLSLKNVEVINSEVERVQSEIADITVFRAFRPLDKAMTKSLLRITKKTGCLAAYKAKKEKIEEEMQGIQSLVPSYEVKSLTVPFLEDTERNLVLIKSI